MGYIYKITNTANDKVYIGKTTVDIKTRWQWHINAFTTTNRPFKSKLYDAMKKYGRDKFSIHVIEECENDMLDERERYWISQYDSFRRGYNLTLGGDGYSVNSDEVHAKILELWNDGLTQKDIVNQLKCDSHVVRRVLYGNGVTRQDVWDRSRAINRPSIVKPVYVYDLDGNFIAEYESVLATAEALGISAEIVGKNANGKYTRACNKYAFRYTKTDRIDPIPPMRNKAYEVHQYSLDGDYIASYQSCLEASRAVGLKDGHTIKDSCQNHTSVAGGYMWRLFKADKIDPVAKRTKRSKCKVMMTSEATT